VNRVPSRKRFVIRGGDWNEQGTKTEIGALVPRLAGLRIAKTGHRESLGSKRPQHLESPTANCRKTDVKNVGNAGEVE